MMVMEQKRNKVKNLIPIFFIGMLLSFLLVLVACGESQQAQHERQQAEQRAADSERNKPL